MFRKVPMSRSRSRREGRFSETARPISDACADRSAIRSFWWRNGGVRCDPAYFGWSADFANAALETRAATPPERYDLQWFRFDNVADSRTPVGAATVTTSGSARAPEGLLAIGDFIGVTITGRHPQHPGWAVPATFFFRRSSLPNDSAGWTLVGVERGQ